MQDATEFFIELFRGNNNHYGVHIPGTVANDSKSGKIEGESFTKTEPLTRQQYIDHIDGKKSLGIVPIDSDGKVRFVAIDIDVYPLEPQIYLTIFKKYKLPFICFRSKSGGLHAFCFFSSDTSAGDVLEQVQIVRHLLGLPKATEVFPKQKRLFEGQKGNWINLPYFNAEESTRYAYDYDGNKLSFDDAMNFCYNHRTTLAKLVQAIDQLPLALAPPCLQTLFLNNGVSVAQKNRNVFLFNAAVYLKARFKDDFHEKLFNLNNELDLPLPEHELNTTIVSSHNKGSYTYQCENAVLHDFCNRELCKNRTFGKGSETITDFSFEQLTQIKSDPPYYYWLVNGFNMVFFSESELRNQNYFLDYSIRYLHKLPKQLKTDVWTEILNKALSDIVIEEVRKVDDISDNALWFSYLLEFIYERALAQRPSQVAMGQVYIENDICYFKPETFVEFLTKTKQFKNFSTSKIGHNLKALGFKSDRIYDSVAKKQLRVWSGELKLLEDQSPDVTVKKLSIFEADTTMKPKEAERNVEKLKNLAKETPVDYDKEPINFIDDRQDNQF